MAKSKPETDWIKLIREYLERRGAVTTRVNSGLQVVGEGESRRVFRGADKGTADIIGCYRGRYFAIEAKVGKNKPTPDQELFLESVREAGGIAFAAWTFDDVDENMGWERYR